MNTKLSRRVTTAAALTVLAVGGAIAGTSPASAATVKPVAAKSAAAAYNGVCGTGYKVIDSTPVGNSGTTYLTWNEAKGKNCAVTIRNTAGAKLYMEVRLTALESEEGDAVDAGQYTSYAGPVYVNGRGYCVSWIGTIGSATSSDWGHCS
ncbi:spore-associated protein A [Streptomyces sp. NPDC092369]|uniref:spore-associated protein A n=1 Tax=Streptomyces sp. NPDC092369 TaxID=3366015 RepID=UPI003813E8BA